MDMNRNAVGTPTMVIDIHNAWTSWAHTCKPHIQGDMSLLSQNYNTAQEMAAIFCFDMDMYSAVLL